MPRARISRAEERALIARFQSGDSQAGHELIKQYHYFIFGKACKLARYPRHDLTVEELCQEGVIGLLIAARRFDPAHSNRFLTYAAWWIRHEMDRATHNTGSTVVVPTYVHGILGAVHKGEAVEKEEHRSIRARLSTVSLDAPYGQSQGWSWRSLTPDDPTLLDVISSHAPTPESVAEANELAARRRKIIAAGLRRLTEKERLVIHYRYLVEETETLQEIGDRLKMTREGARLIERSALRKLGRVEEIQRLSMQAA